MRALLVIMLCAVGVPVHAEAQPGPSAALVSGIDAYNRGDIATARTLLQAAADQGEPEAMVNLGYLYARGHGVNSDPAYALQLYRHAAAAGDGEGMNAVGYRYNIATPPNLEQAVHWYCRALARGNPRAMNNLALLFYNGRGVAQDRDEARRLWRQAVARGSLNAQANLGVDQASDATLSAAERGAGYAMLRDAALNGSAFAQQILRRNGDAETFPPATVTDLTMKLEPRAVPPGSSYVCDPDVIS